MAGSQKITLWDPQRTPLIILRVKYLLKFSTEDHYHSLSFELF